MATKVGQNSNVWVVWNVLPVDYSEDKLEEIRLRFAKKYSIEPSQVKVMPNYYTNEGGESVSLNQSAINNIQDPKFQQELFKQYLEEKGITDYDWEEILKIDSQINSQIDYDSYEQGRRYKLKWIDWSNFLSYGPNNHFDFTKLKGLVLLNGTPANQSGKSTFAYDLLHFLFFGRTKSGKAEVLSEYFNRYLPNETELKVEGCIEVDGIDYVIRRTLTRPAAGKKTRTVTQKVEYFRVCDNGELEDLAEMEDLRGENNVKTTKAIKEAIGNEQDFDLVISANSDNLKDLISLKDTERGRLLSRWIGLMPIEDKDVKAREMWNKTINVKRVSSLYNKEQLSIDIDGLNTSIGEKQGEIERYKKIAEESNAKITEEGDKRDKLLASLQKVDETIANTDVTTVERQLEDLTEKGKTLAASIEALKASIAAYGDVSFNVDEYQGQQNEKEGIIEEIVTIKSAIKTLKDTNKSLAESEYCPVCHRKFDNVDNSATIKDNENKINALIANGVEKNKRKEELEASLTELEKRRKLNFEKNKAEVQLSAQQVNLTQLRSDYKEKKAIIKQINDNKEAIRRNNEINAQINIVKANIYTEEQIRNNANNEVTINSRDIVNMQNQIKEKQVLIQKILEEEKIEKNWKIYLLLIGKDGISKMVLRNALPIINSELKRLLDGVCNFDVLVEINEKNDVEFYLVSDGVKQSLASGSGFEQTAASLALRVVLGNMSSLSKPPFLLLDEVLGGVAQENYDNIKKLYDKILANYDFIFQITHLNNEVVDWHDMTVTVSKGKDHISHISQV